MFKFASLLSAAFLAASVAAQQQEWQQCGGNGWTGGTTCVSPYVCTYSNDWYSQCLPGTGNSGGSSSSSKSSSSVKSSSTSSVRTTSTSTVSTKTSSVSTKSSSSPVTSVTPAAGNPYTGWNVWASTFYASEVYAAAALVTDTALKAKISKVALVPTFTWFDTIAKVADLPGYLTAASGQILQIVIYDLPNRDCHANASNGELTYANNGAALYQGYINSIASAIKASSGTRVVAVVEPDSLANLVTNLSDSRCSSVQTQYEASVTYAASTLAAAGVYLYLDAGHAGWLGWTSNLQPAATLFLQIWTSAGKSSYIRGLATDVANYNSLTTTSPDPITQGDPCYDEMLYIQALAPLLANGGWNAQFIVDQGRSGVQNIRTQWGDWCNIKGAGFGMRPTTNTGSPYIDAIVWVKPGGECDGTSNTSAARFDPTCALSDALQPAPEAGTWFQQYFLDLVNNANPSF